MFLHAGVCRILVPPLATAVGLFIELLSGVVMGKLHLKGNKRCLAFRGPMRGAMNCDKSPVARLYSTGCATVELKTNGVIQMSSECVFTCLHFVVKVWNSPFVPQSGRRPNTYIP